MNSIEQKTAVINSVTNLGTYPLSGGDIMTKYGITFQGSPTTWEYHTSKPNTQFVQGQEATFTIETKVNGQYTNYRIKPVKGANPSTGGGGFKKSGFGGGSAKSPEQNRLITLQGIFGAICTKAQGNEKVTVDHCWTATEKIYNLMMIKAYTPHPVEGGEGAVAPNPINPTPIS